MAYVTNTTFNALFENDQNRGIWGSPAFNNYVRAYNRFIDDKNSPKEKLVAAHEAVSNLQVVAFDKMSTEQANIIRDTAVDLSSKLASFTENEGVEYGSDHEIIAGIRNRLNEIIYGCSKRIEYIQRTRDEVAGPISEFSEAMKKIKEIEFAKRAAIGAAIGAFVFALVPVAGGLGLVGFNVGFWTPIAVGASIGGVGMHAYDRVSDLYKTGGEGWKEFRAEHTYQTIALSLLTGMAIGQGVSVAANALAKSSALDKLENFINTLGYVFSRAEAEKLLNVISENSSFLTLGAGIGSTLSAFDYIDFVKTFKASMTYIKNYLEVEAKKTEIALDALNEIIPASNQWCRIM